MASSNPKSSQNKALVAICALAMLVACVLYVRKKRAPKLAAQTPVAAAPVTPAVKTFDTPQETAATGESADALKSRQRRADLEHQNNFGRVAFHNDNGVYTLPVRLSIQERCSAGDIEVMKAGLGKQSDKTVLLTVEEATANGGTKTLGAQALTLADLKDGQTFTFNVTPSKAVQPLAIYLCSDQASAKSCGGKAFVNVSPIFGPKRSAKGSPDIIYFAGTMLADQGGVSFSNAFLGNKRELGHVDSYLKGRSVPAADQQRIDRQFKALTAGASSVPLASAGGAVQITLARHRDGDSCAEPLLDEIRRARGRP